MEIIANKHDVSSYSNFDKVRQEKIRINSTIDFNNRRIFGIVDLTFNVLDKDEQRVILDTKNLIISSLDLNKTEFIKANEKIYL